MHTGREKKRGRPGLAVAVFVTATAAGWPGDLASQTWLDYVECTECSLTVSRVVELPADDHGGGITGQPTAIVRDDAGNWYVTTFSGNTIQVFDRTGTLIREIGREGRGPGEFRDVSAMAIRRDSLYVIDTANQRLTVISVAGEFGRSVPIHLAAARSLTMRDGRSAVVTGAIPTIEGSGLPLHEIDVDGAGLRSSYGDLSRGLRPSAPWLRTRAIALTPDGQVWTAHRTAYELERWDSVGNRTAHVERRLSWFEPYIDRAIGLAAPPKPWLMAIQMLTPRHLLVGITRPVDDYTRLLGPPVSTATGDFYDRDRRRLLYDTVLEVIDLEKNVVIKRALFDQYMIGSLPAPGHVATYDEEDGVPKISVYRIDLQIPGPPSR